MAGWIQIDGKLIPREEYYGDNTRNQAPMFIPDIEPFISPIDGDVITTRPMLKRHMKAHGVTHQQDYSRDYIESRAKERLHKQETEGKRERIESIRRQLGD